MPVTIFAAIATGGIAQQPITSFEYKNVGVNIDITPRVHHDGEVTLELKLDISAVGPPGFQGLPTFNSRTVNSTIRLRDGETNMLAGLILDNERYGLTGIPGRRRASRSSGGSSRGTRRRRSQTDIVMTLTPHVIRRPEITEEDLRSFLVGGERLAVPLRHARRGRARRPAPAPDAEPRIRAAEPPAHPSRSGPPSPPDDDAPGDRAPTARPPGSSGSAGRAQLLDLDLADAVALDVHDREPPARRAATTSPPLGTEPSRSSMKPATVSNSADSGSGIS